MAGRVCLAIAQFLLLVVDCKVAPVSRVSGRFVTPSSRLVAAESILEDSDRRRSSFPLQRMENIFGYHKLDQRDRSFARALVTIVERRKGQLDKVVSHFRERKLHSRKRHHDYWVDSVLRLGAAQLLFMDIPSHAAVKETVDVLRSASSPVPDSKIKFANALLRRISIDGKNVLEKETKASDNIAPWLLRRLTEDWGEEEALKISDAFMTQAPIHLSVKYPNTANSEPPLKQKIEEVRDALNGQTVILPNGSLRAGDDLGGQVSNWPLYDEGAWWVQDASATLPAKVLFSSLQGNANMSDLHVIDMCAAPGGKTAQLISMGIGKVTAVENSEKRTRRLEKNLDRLAMSNQCNIVVADGSSWIPDDTVHGILLDVPCSATGTGSKRPDVLRRSEDLQELLDTQERLANNCADKILAPGGILVYATCSILKDESESQVVKLLSRSNGAKLETVPIQAEEVPGFESCIDEQGWLRVLPGTLSESMGPCDGFFVARLKRTC